MCGRFANNETIEAMALRFRATPTVRPDEWAPTYNAAPTHFLPVVIQDAKSRRIGLMRWGWPQSWNPRGLHVNAIGETAPDKPAFAEAFAKRRCLVPATAFYEWQSLGRQKLPYAFRLPGQDLFGIAGLWQMIEMDGKRVGAFILLTTVANEVVKPVHHRMAAMLPVNAEDLWLDPATPVDQLRTLLAAYDAAAMTATRVSGRVNKVANNDADLLRPSTGEPGETPPSS
jgi:putative SOS response-associated peptidase YedK